MDEGDGSNRETREAVLPYSSAGSASLDLLTPSRSQFVACESHTGDGRMSDSIAGVYVFTRFCFHFHHPLIRFFLYYLCGCGAITIADSPSPKYLSPPQQRALQNSYTTVPSFRVLFLPVGNHLRFVDSNISSVATASTSFTPPTTTQP
jgi:hypothetical protein